VLFDKARIAEVAHLAAQIARHHRVEAQPQVTLAKPIQPQQAGEFDAVAAHHSIQVQ